MKALQKPLVVLFTGVGVVIYLAAIFVSIAVFAIWKLVEFAFKVF